MKFEAIFLQRRKIRNKELYPYSHDMKARYKLPYSKINMGLLRYLWNS